MVGGITGWLDEEFDLAPGNETGSLRKADAA
jgi:hypothetical protein